ncbi:hypothetical protein GOV12_03180 [Candidatus Pacearchaeota archaeon]|nr:hypothetical protein [Candidatus Pacearchaeota archaeon]
MTKEFSKIFSYAVIGLFIILALYLGFFLISSGFLSNLLTGKAIGELSIEDYVSEEELNEVNADSVMNLFYNYWWVLIIIFILIIILIILIIIVRKSKRKSIFIKEQSPFESTGDPITDKALSLIKNSKDVGLSDKDIKKIFKEAEWKDSEFVKILKKYYEVVGKLEEEEIIEKPVKNKDKEKEKEKDKGNIKKK